MTDAGKRRFAEVTQECKGKRLAIIIGGQLYAAPKIMSEISDGRAVITGYFGASKGRAGHKDFRVVVQMIATLNPTMAFTHESQPFTGVSFTCRRSMTAPPGFDWGRTSKTCRPAFSMVTLPKSQGLNC